MTSIPKRDPVFTGTPRAVTAPPGDDSVEIANTAWYWNEHDAIPEATLYRSANINNFFPNATWEPVTFNSQESSIVDMTHAANAAKLVATQGGLYLIQANVTFQSNAVGNRFAALAVNQNGAYAGGAGAAAYSSSQATAVAATKGMNLSALVRLSAGDHVELYGRQDSGSAKDLIGGDGYTTLRAVRMKR